MCSVFVHCSNYYKYIIVEERASASEARPMGAAVASRHCCCKQALLLQAGTAVASRHCCCKQALLLQAGTAVASRHCCCKQALLLCRHDYLTALLATYCLAVALSIVRYLANNGRLSLHRCFLHGRRVIQHL